MMWTIGPVPDDRRDDWWGVQETAFAFEFKEDEKERFGAAQDWARAFGAYDGDLLVGSAASLTLAVTVPGGGGVPTAGLTAVSVLPTHRRRGVLTGLMSAAFEDARARSEPLSALLASEAPIYGRFGYGPATRTDDFTIPHHHAVLREHPPSPGRVRLLTVEEARRVVPPLHTAATIGLGFPGSVVRTPAMWDLAFYDPEHWRAGASARTWVLYEDAAGEPRGYAAYRIKEKWDEGVPMFRLSVGALHALDAEAHTALYDYLFGIDLVREVAVAWRRPGDPLLEMVADLRRVQRLVRDGLWLRLIDVPAALAARRYRVEGRVVLEVRDRACPWNEGRFLLEGGPDGASCAPTDAPAEVALDAADLASAYLGSGNLAAQAWAGRVQGSPEAVDRTALMMSWGVEAWNTVMF